MIEELPLGYAEQPNPPNRPRPSEERFCKLAAHDISGHIVSWLSECEDLATVDDDLIDQLTEAIKFSSDGFRRAKYLCDSYLWEGDTKLVEILDSASTFRHHRAAVEEWVVSNRITPKRGLYSVVRYRGEVGTITAIKRETAEYIVQTDVWLRQNPEQRQYPTSGYLVPFEDVEKEDQTP